MKKITSEQIEKNKAKRLEKSNRKGLIRRNTWGIEQNLESKPYAIPNGPIVDSPTYQDLAGSAVERAVLKIKYIRRASKELDSMLKHIKPEDIVQICKELGVDIDTEEILGSKEISEKFKWEIIYNMDKAV